MLIPAEDGIRHGESLSLSPEVETICSRKIFGAGMFEVADLECAPSEEERDE